MKGAYEYALTPENIKGAFRKTGLWPVDTTGLLCRPLPADEIISGLASAPMLVTNTHQMNVEKREKVNAGLQLQAVTPHRGVLATT